MSIANLCLHERLAAQAAATPEAIALRWSQGELSYGELDRRANVLANRLRRLGVGPEVRVALCLERGPELVVSLLGVLKAGGAYVPLDPSHPRARRLDILADCQPSLVISQSAYAGDLIPPTARPGNGRPLPSDPADGSAANTAPSPTILLIDEVPFVPAAEDLIGPPPTADPANLAYVLYTSGSTGRPKGVMVEHRQVMNTLMGNLPAFGFSPADTMPVIASFAFDIVLFELFGPLLTGGTAVLLDRDEVLDLGRFVTTLKQCTLLHTLPSLMFEVAREIIRRGRADDYLGLRRVFVGGEAVPAELLTLMRQAFPSAELTVLYGPTECSIICAAYHVPGDAEPLSQGIGRPLANMRLVLHDADGRPVPADAEGEICVAGPSVSRGYLNRPELTAERYVVVDGERFYRTGDLGRPSADGNLTFAGRADQQVKIRGFRIELGDVESALLGHGAVRQAAVVPRDDPRQGRHLVAYWVGDETSTTASDLRRHVAALLPDYMVPAYFVQRSELPLTPNGKVDRQALAATPVEVSQARDTSGSRSISAKPGPSSTRSPSPGTASRMSPSMTPTTSAESSDSSDAPASRAQRPKLDGVAASLADLWAAVLGHRDFGLDDGFFHVGGSSLSAAQLLVKLNERFGLDLAVRALFDAPTLREQADAVRRAHGTRMVEGRRDKSSSAPSADDTSANAPTSPDSSAPIAFPLSAAEERLWFLDQLEPGTPVYNITLAKRLRGALDHAILADAFDAVAARHGALRSRFEKQRSGAPVRVVEGGAGLRLVEIDLSTRPAAEREAEAARTIAWDTERPFDLSRGPLLRLTLIRLAEDEHVLVLTVHHIVFDGWSAGLFFDELAATYAKRLAKPSEPVRTGAGADASGVTTDSRPTEAGPPRDGRSPATNAPDHRAFVRWQQAWLIGPESDRQRSFWRQQLKDAPATELAADRPRPKRQSFRAAAADLVLPLAQVEAAIALGKTVGATPFMVFLAVCLTLVAERSASDDLVVGTPFAERARGDTQGVIAMLVNSLALRVRLDGHGSFTALLRAVRAACLEAYANHELPFDRVVEAVNPPRDPSRNPLFSVFFALQNAPDAATLWDGLQVENALVPIHSSPFDLALNIEPAAGDWPARLHYATDLFDSSTAESIAARYATLLEALVAAPDVPLVEMVRGDFSVNRRGGKGSLGTVGDTAGTTGRSSADAALPSAGSVVGSDPAGAQRDAAPATETTSPAQRALEARLATMWQSLLALESVGPTESFFDLGGHSLLAARLLGQVADELGHAVPVAAFFQHPTVRSLAAHLIHQGAMSDTAEWLEMSLESPVLLTTSEPGRARAGQPPASHPALVALQAGGGQRPIFAVHPLGGHVLAYLPLAQALGPDQPFYGLQAPGLVDPSIAYDSVEAMADDYLVAVRQIQPSGPYRLAGWSLGGMVAYAMARRLRQEGQAVETLFLIDSCAPLQGRIDGSAAAEAAFLADYGAELARRSGRTLALDAAVLAGLAPAERVEHFLTEAEAAGAIPAEWGVGEERRILQVCQSNAALMAAYRPMTYAGGATLLRAAGSPRPADMPDDLGWSALCQDGVDVAPVPGDHGSCLEAPQVSVLAGAIRDRLDAAHSTPTAHQEPRLTVIAGTPTTRERHVQAG